MAKKGKQRRFSKKTIILILVLLIYSALMRVVHAVSFVPDIALFWALPFVLIGAMTFLSVKKMDISLDDQLRYLIPNRLYIIFLICLLPYILINLVLVMYDPNLIQNPLYLPR